MARITGPVWKKSRRLGFSVLETGEELTKRNYAPGQHGPTKRVKLTNYGLQLREKQRIRYRTSDMGRCPSALQRCTYPYSEATYLILDDRIREAQCKSGV